MLKMSTLTSGARRTICAVASMPFSSGMAMSRTATSGFSASAWRTASRPSPASATTCHSGFSSTILRSPWRTIVWSSARSSRSLGMEGVLAAWFCRQFCDNSRAAADRAVDANVALQLDGALAHAQQAQAAPPAGVRPGHGDIEAFPIVFDHDRERVAFVAERHATGACVGMASHVGQRLLHDAVRRQLHVWRELRPLAVLHQFGLDVVPLTERLQIPIDRGGKPDIIEERRMQQ